MAAAGATMPLESKATLITTGMLQNFISRIATEQDESLTNVKIELNRELRGKTFHLVQLILQQPLQEMISTGAPSLLSTLMPNFNKTNNK